MALRDDRDNWKSKYMYTLADFDTYKRNAEKEKKNDKNLKNEIKSRIIDITFEYRR